MRAIIYEVKSIVDLTLNLRFHAIIPHKNTPCIHATFHAIMQMWVFVVANAQLTNKMCRGVEIVSFFNGRCVNGSH